MRKFGRIIFVIAVVFLSNSNTAFAEFVILQSETKNYAAGQIITDSMEIELLQGESLTMLSEGGDIIEVQGPYIGKPAGPDLSEFDLRTALTNLIDSPNNVHATLGSTRGGGTEKSMEENRPAWALDPFDSGMQCVLDSMTVNFWRADTNQEQSLAIQRPGHEGSGNFSWEIGQALAEWPDSMPIVSEELYIVRRPGWMENAMIRLIVIPPEISHKLETSIAWLAVNGCKTQARLLLQKL